MDQIPRKKMLDPLEIVIARTADTLTLQRHEDFAGCSHFVAMLKHARGESINQ
jgi:hypothetical protein